LHYPCAFSSAAFHDHRPPPLQAPDPGAPDLAADFAAAGFTVCGQGDCAHLVRETLRAAPDVLVCWAPRPGAELLQALATLQAQQPMPVLFFTQDAGVEPLQRALDAGVHAWVVQGYGRERLRPLVHLAQAREAHERQLRAQAGGAGREAGRAQVGRQGQGHPDAGAAGERGRGLPAAAHRLDAGQPAVGQVSRQVIDAARTAEAINRAGQQRMLSQRLVKLYALGCSRTETRPWRC
jgi:CheY-like chemotaxis protein